MLLLTVAAVLCVSTQGTYAWFTDAASNLQTFEIGDIKYIYSGTLSTVSDNEIVVPGEQLLTSGNLYLNNKSKIDTNLRVQIRCHYTDQQTGQPVDEIYGAAGCQMSSFINISMVSSWVYDSTDQCWHFKYNDDYLIPASTTDDGYFFNIIDTIQFNGSTIDNSLSGAVYQLKIIFQAKQANFVNWETIGTGDIDALAAS